MRKEGEPLVELINFSYRISTEKGIFQKHNPIYKAQLSQLLSDCAFEATPVGYEEKPIIRVLDKYSDCRGVTTAGRKGLEGLVHLGGLLGAVTVPVGLGVGPYWNKQAPVAGVALQVLSRKNFENRFALVELGVFAGSLPGLIPMERIHLAVYAGTFFGRKKIQGLVYSGGSRYGGLLDTGLGLSYQKKLTLVLGAGLLNLESGHGFWMKLRYHPRFKAQKM